MALEGIQPTLRQVPPRAPRFSIQATYKKCIKKMSIGLLIIVTSRLSLFYYKHSQVTISIP
jgi:hypothetical protein